MLDAGVAMLAASKIAPVRSQTRSPRRIGYLSVNSKASVAWLDGVFESVLASHGWTLGRDLLIDYRYGDGDTAQTAEAAQSLVASRPDVLVTATGPGVSALRALTDSIPIVATNLTDPVGTGLVSNLARPGGNVTGVTGTNGPGILAKRMQMLMSFVPRARRVAVLRVPGEVTDALWQEIVDAARALELTMLTVDAVAKDIPAKFPAIAAWRPDALFPAGQGPSRS